MQRLTCTSCGAPLAPVDQAGASYCTYCGTPYQSTTRVRKRQVFSDYSSDILLDELDEIAFGVAVFVAEKRVSSADSLRRQFNIGFTRVARIIDQLEALGIVGPFEGEKPRRILVSNRADVERAFQNAPDDY